MYRLIFAALLVLSGCAGVVVPPQQEAFGITMVEETECIGLGGRIMTGPEGSFCVGGAGR